MIEQGSAEWLEARRGKITASRFADVMIEPRAKKDKEAGKLSDSAESYLCELLWETFTGQHYEVRPTVAMRWGTEHESVAREVYELTRGVEVEAVGFQTVEGTDIGCSPDGLVGRGGIEIKCPYGPVEHIRAWRRNEVPKQYRWQVVGTMLVCGLEWMDFVSFDPRMRLTKNAIHVIRVERDEAEIGELWAKLRRFNEILNDAINERKQNK